VHLALAVDDSKAKEKKCMPHSGKSVDLNWLGGAKILYVPLWNPLSHCRKASIQLGKSVKDLTMGDVSKPACFEFYQDAKAKGFGATAQHIVTINATHLVCSGTKDIPLKSVYSYDLTDNKTFLLSILCWEDGEASWLVLSCHKELAPESKKLILDYVASKGFNPKVAIAEDYKTC